MNKDELDGVLRAYRGGATADFLQAKIGAEWGGYWTVPPCSPPRLEKAAQQFLRMRADAVRYIRRARLTGRAGCGNEEVVVFTELPGQQEVYLLASGEQITTGKYLEDDALTALTTSFIPIVK
jgi:hypothetical protein